MRTAKRTRQLLGTVEKPCRVCNAVTVQQIEVSAPAKRRFGLPHHDYVDLDSRRWSKCSQCGFRFAERIDEH